MAGTIIDTISRKWLKTAYNPDNPDSERMKKEHFAKVA